MRKSAVSAAVAAAFVITAPAQANCITKTVSDAARIHHLQTMLMVAALRCRNGRDDFMGKYNSFIRTSRTVLAGANGELRGHYTKRFGIKGGLAGYDRRGVQLANRYGAGTGESCATMRQLAIDAADHHRTREQLVALAERAGVESELPERVCSLSIAAK